MRALILRSVEIKAGIVRSGRARRRNPAQDLNFGHTLGHAIESESGYALLHGEAIAIGMVLEALLGERLGIAAPGTASAAARHGRARADFPARYPGISIAHAHSCRNTRRQESARRASSNTRCSPRSVAPIAGVRAPDEAVLERTPADAAWAMTYARPERRHLPCASRDRPPTPDQHVLLRDVSARISHLRSSGLRSRRICCTSPRQWIGVGCARSSFGLRHFDRCATHRSQRDPPR